MNNFTDETRSNAILYGWQTRNKSMYYGFPIITPDDNEGYFIEQTMGRLDLVPKHLIWSNLSSAEKHDMNKLLEVIRAWWEFPRWISTLLFCAVILLASILTPEKDWITFTIICIIGGMAILVATIIGSIVVASYYIKFIALRFPGITWVISWISIIICTIIATLNSHLISILIAFGWWIVVYFTNTLTRIVVWRIKRTLFLRQN